MVIRPPSDDELLLTAGAFVLGVIGLALICFLAYLGK